jgi:hypothetical protein
MGFFYVLTSKKFRGEEILQKRERLIFRRMGCNSGDKNGLSSSKKSVK